MYQSLIVVDDFYDHPMEVRKVALGLNYPRVEAPLTFPGRNSEQPFLPPGLDQVVSRFVSEPLRGSSRPNVAHGRFRITVRGEESRYLVHVDPTFLSWVGLVYLTPTTPASSGTAFFRHVEFDSDRVPSEAALQASGLTSVAELLQRDGRDERKWEHLMTLPARFNRLILYRPWLWHSAGQAFGSTLEDGRLVHLVFFESRRPAER